jgi:integrase
MLTEVQIKNAKAREKPYRLYDERGMYFEVRPAVDPKKGKMFCLKFKLDGRERYMSLGTYPETSLKEARQRRDEYRKLVKSGIDPIAQRNAAKVSVSRMGASAFEGVAREWYLRFSPNWSASHSKTVIRRLEADIFPWLKHKSVGEITALELLAVLRKVEERGALETAHRELQICGQVFRYAIATGRAERDISADLRGALPPVPKNNHHAAVTEPNRLGELLRIMDGYQGSFIVKCALRLAPILFVRPGELRHAEWQDIDLETHEWRFLVSKTGQPHIVPLATQAVEILRELHQLTGQGVYVFPGPRSALRPLSENGVLAALRNLDIPKEEMSGHGFRATARTMLDEILKFPPHLIEHQLGHTVKDPLGRSYNRTQHLEERKVMMQRWADYLDELRCGSHDN